MSNNQRSNAQIAWTLTKVRNNPVDGIVKEVKIFADFGSEVRYLSSTTTEINEY